MPNAPSHKPARDIASHTGTSNTGTANPYTNRTYPAITPSEGFDPTRRQSATSTASQQPSGPFNSISTNPQRSFPPSSRQFQSTPLSGDAHLQLAERQRMLSKREAARQPLYREYLQREQATSSHDQGALERGIPTKQVTKPPAPYFSSSYQNKGGGNDWYDPADSEDRSHF